MNGHRRGASSLGMVLVQAAVLALIGAGIGLADSRIRPIKLTMETPPGPTTGPAAAPDKPIPSGDGGETPANGTTTTEPPVATPPVVTPPVATPPTQPVAASPTAPAPFTPTTAAALAGKPNHITLERGLEMLQIMGATFLDARNADEFAAGHIQGAHRAGLDRFRKGDVPAVLLSQPKDFPIVVYCSGGESCEASEDVALHLNGLGFVQVYILHDGIVGWTAMGYPTETGAGE